MKNKAIMLVLSVAIIASLVVVGCAKPTPTPPAPVPAPPPAPAPAPPPKPAFPELLPMGTGSAGGGYHMLTMGLLKYWKEELGIELALTPGVVLHNLRRFEAKRIDILVSPSVWMYAGWIGEEELGFPVPIRDLRIMFYIYPNPFYIIALKDSGMTKIADLKGKRVGLGPKAAVWDRMLGPKLEANGIKYFEDPDIGKTFATWSDMCEMVGDGTLDACVAMVEGVMPQPATMKLMEEKELVALEWDPAVIKQFEGTVFCPAVIKKEALPFLDEDHHCFEGGVASIVVRDTMDEDLIYALTKTFYENLDKLAAENPYWGYPVQFPEILTADYGIPYHPGAIKYWKEVGIWTIPGVE